MKPQQVRSIAADEVERRIGTVEDRELVIRALIRDELASLAGTLLEEYGQRPPATDVGLEDATRIRDASLGTLGGLMLHKYGDRTVVHGVAEARSDTTGG